jgi:hypothetical protein
MIFRSRHYRQTPHRDEFRQIADLWRGGALFVFPIEQTKS